MAARYFVGIDVGGQSIKGGVVDDSGCARSSVALPTEAYKGQEHGLEQMAEAVRRAVAAAGLHLSDIAAIGVATPGTMDIPAGMILDPPNLKPWKNVPVRDFIQKTFRLPTAFQNDANAAAYGEYWAGAGRGVHSLVLFTLGTGIGCGIVVGGMIIEGEHSHGAEVGHIIIEHERPRQCGCGGWGHLEAYASATAIAARTTEALQRTTSPSVLHRLLAGRPALAPEDTEEIFKAAAEGDALAATIVEDTARFLAIGAVNMMHTIDPDMIVFGGGMTRAGLPFLERIRWHVRHMAFPVPAQKTHIVYAHLGSEAGIIGAAGCAKMLYEKTAA
ncbi:MAG: sugar kinase [Gemmataceae bacterium]